MPITKITTKTLKLIYTIKIEGVFDFALRNQFRRAYEGVINEFQYVVDLTAVDSIDSSAISMLMMLNDHMDGRKTKLILSRGNKEMNLLFGEPCISDKFTVTYFP